MNTRLLFNTSAVIEMLTGVTMLVVPSMIISLLLGEGVNPIGIAVVQILGIGLLSLGIACREPLRQDARLSTRIGLCTYNLGVAIALTIFAAAGGMNGLLLWPAMALHVVIGAMMLWMILAAPSNS